MNCHESCKIFVLIDLIVNLHLYESFFAAFSSNVSLVEEYKLFFGPKSAKISHIS